MEETKVDKAPKPVQKSFMTSGPTLHYSHKNVQRCWLAALVVFFLSCLVWSRIVSGSLWSFSLDATKVPEFWRLEKFVSMGVSIFEYPWQILVLGLLMGLFGIVPLLVSQLMSFKYSLPFVALVFIFAGLPAFAVCLLISCVAAASRPLRFRSRIIAIALCTAPQLMYWGFFGGDRTADPIEWGFSYTPWACAWLSGMAMAGFVLGIGHFTRYKPGLVWIFTTITLIIACVVFDAYVGFDELDYQLYVAKNNPEQIEEFHEHSITHELDATITDPQAKKHFEGFFFPTEPIPLRAELKRRIQYALASGHWPDWFVVSDKLKYQQKREQLDKLYDLFIKPPKPFWMPRFLYDEFIKGRAVSNRMATALYYKAMLSEYSPDLQYLESHEILRFYSDYPHERSSQLWMNLYQGFPARPESLEARWRIARHWAGKGRFEEATRLISEALSQVALRLTALAESPPKDETIFKPFRPPAQSPITAFDLGELQRRLRELEILISNQNRTKEPSTRTHLAEFVMLDPHSLEYSWHLDRLLEQMGQSDPLRDNILLAKAKLTADEQSRAEKFMEVHGKFPKTDGGIQALYQLGLLRIAQWRRLGESETEKKKQLLAEARTALEVFVDLYPDSIYAEQVKLNLAALPEGG